MDRQTAAIPPWRTVAILSAIAFTLGAINFVIILPEMGNSTFAVRKLFELDFEQSIPTWYTVILMFLVVVLGGFVTWRRTVEKGPFARHWFYLSLIFFMISVDEVTGVHERFSNFRGVLGNANGYFFMAWVIPGLIFLVVFGIAYIKFTLHLPRPLRELFVASLAIYFFGAVGMEMISTNVLVSTGEAVVTRTYIALTIVEELMELNGVILLIGTLLAYVQQTFDLRLSFRAGEEPVLVVQESPAEERAASPVPSVEGAD